MAPRGYSTSYRQKILDAREKLAREIPQLEVAIMEGIIQFAADMQEHTGADLPSSRVAFAAVVLPYSFKNLNHKICFKNHTSVMLLFGKCVFQGRCFYFGLPRCRWCEKNAPWYPPQYYVPYEIMPYAPPGWGEGDVADEAISAGGEVVADDV